MSGFGVGNSVGCVVTLDLCCNYTVELLQKHKSDLMRDKHKVVFSGISWEILTVYQKLIFSSIKNTILLKSEFGLPGCKKKKSSFYETLILIHKQHLGVKVQVCSLKYKHIAHSYDPVAKTHMQEITVGLCYEVICHIWIMLTEHMWNGKHYAMKNVILLNLNEGEESKTLLTQRSEVKLLRFKTH